jgi:hypothetical protein
MADVPNVIGGDFDPLSPQPTPGAAALNGGGAAADDAAERKARAEYYRSQTEELGRLGKREEELYQKKEEEEAPLRRELTGALREQTRIGNAATARFLGQQQDVPPPPQFNGKEAQADAIAWMNLAAGFGAIAGGLSRYHTTTALNSFAGMMNGFAKGQILAYEKNYNIWQANADRALEYNNRAGREYKAIMDNAHLNIDTKSNLMQMTADKWQDQIMANAARLRDVSRMTQLMEGQERFGENLTLRKQAIEDHNSHWQQAIDMRKDQMYGSSQDVHGTADQISSLAVPMPNANMQARYPYLRAAAREVMQRNPGYQASDYTANQALKKAASTADVMAMRSALTKLTQMKTALDTFEPVAKLNGQMLLGLIGQVDQTGTQTVLEAWMRAGKKATGDPNVQQFDMAIQNLSVESARILQNPNLVGQLTDSMRGEMQQLLPQNITKGNVERAVPMLFNEMDYRKQLIDSQVQFLNESIRAAATPGAPRPTYVNPEPPPIVPEPLVVPGGGGGTDEYQIEPQ